MTNGEIGAVNASININIDGVDVRELQPLLHAIEEVMRLSLVLEPDGHLQAEWEVVVQTTPYVFARYTTF